MKCFSTATVSLPHALRVSIVSKGSYPEIRYYDIVTIRHKDTKVFLHSHVERYPLSYDDGRISSQGAFSFALPGGSSLIVYIRL